MSGSINVMCYDCVRYLLPLTLQIFVEGTAGVVMESPSVNVFNDADAAIAPTVQAKLIYVAHPMLSFYTQYTKIFELGQELLLDMDQLLGGIVISPIENVKFTPYVIYKDMGISEPSFVIGSYLTF